MTVRKVSPMLASPAGTLPPLGGWTIEPKWDGVRVVAEVTKTRVHLWSRNGIDKQSQFPDVAHALSAVQKEHGPVVLDGELVALDKAGKPLRFQALQQRGQTAARTAFVAFDCLFADARALIDLPWTARRAALEAVVARSTKAIVRRGDSFVCGSAGARRLLAAATSEGWEGLILKHTESLYLPGKRSPWWRKVKLEREQEFVIGGYTLPGAGTQRTHFGALLVGYYTSDGELRYAGKVGTGYTHATLALLARKFASLKRTKCPFVAVPREREKSMWLKPSLVAQIRYNEMTESGLLRQPTFLGLRDDKAAKDVRLEASTSAAAVRDLLRCGRTDA